jgi:hypothetical protein
MCLPHFGPFSFYAGRRTGTVSAFPICAVRGLARLGVAIISQETIIIKTLEVAL